MLRRVLAAAAVPALLATAGCGVRLGSGLSAREEVVFFSPQATQAQHAAVLVACGHVTPAASPEPLPPLNAKTPLSTRINDVRFRVDKASDFQLNQLNQCLMRQPGVVGETIPDTTEQ